MMPIKVSYRVIYGDTDAMGVVYYANYLRLFEMGRSEWLRAIGVPYGQIEAWGVYAPATQAYCHYLSPARYEDSLIVETDLEYLKRASIKFVYKVLREEDLKAIAQGYTVHAFVDRNGRIVSTPELLRERIRGICAGKSCEVKGG